jgi:hypothetical protein
VTFPARHDPTRAYASAQSCRIAAVVVVVSAVLNGKAPMKRLDFGVRFDRHLVDDCSSHGEGS